MKLFDFEVRHFAIVVTSAAGLMFSLDYTLPLIGMPFGAADIAELSAVSTVLTWLAFKDRIRK